MPVSMNNPTKIGRTKKDWQCHGCQVLIPAGSNAVLVEYVADGRFYRTLHLHVRCGEGVRQLGAELDALYRRHTNEYLDVMRRIKELSASRRAAKSARPDSGAEERSSTCRAAP